MLALAISEMASAHRTPRTVRTSTQCLFCENKAANEKCKPNKRSYELGGERRARGAGLTYFIKTSAPVPPLNKLATTPPNFLSPQTCSELHIIHSINIRSNHTAAAEHELPYCL